MIDFINNNPRIKEFKKQAKILLRHLKESKADITLRACHDLVAQQHGYKHWYEFHKEIKNLYEQKEKEVKQYFFKTSPLGYFNYGYSGEIGLHYCLDRANTVNHTLITGEKRDKVNLHLLKQAIYANDHVVYMDGDGKDIDDIIKIAISAGRQKDLRVISFMGNLKDVKSDKMPNKLPGSSEALTEMFASLMDDYGETIEDIYVWRGRAISLLSCVMRALVYMRDNEAFVLSFESIGKYLILDNIINLYQREFPAHIHNALRDYLLSLPDFQESSSKQNDTVLEQHGHLQMQFIKLLGSLSDSYGYLFSNNANLNYSEFTGQEQNLIILFKYPSLDKSIYEIGHLARFVMSMIKLQLQFDVKPKRHMTWLINNCPIHRGFAVVPAQARFNNISMICSYSDTGFLNSNKDEAASVIANCNIKIEMKNDSEYSLKYKTVLYTLKV